MGEMHKARYGERVWTELPEAEPETGIHVHVVY